MDQGWRARLAAIRDADGALIDHAVALPLPAPRTFTGEDMLELTVHGSPFIVAAVVDAFRAAGARPAEPGEFTRRALANDKLDLVQAEAINELASAETAAQARMAQAQLDGALSRRFNELKEELVELLAVLEGGLDFVAQEVALDEDAARARREGAWERLQALLATAAPGRRIRDGVRVVIAGPPNSGKSTLFNALASEERAIVSPHPGTTRDLVEVVLEMGGVPVVLQDTAGIGDTDDPVEREGVRRARGATATADAVVWLWPADGGRAPDVPEVTGQVALRLRSKWDLAAARAPEDGWMPVSCHSGEGLELVRRTLAEAVAEDVADLGGNAAIAERHRTALERAAAELEGLRVDEPELAAEAARNALDAVRELLGEVAAEDVLDRIFGRFCIGK